MMIKYISSSVAMLTSLVCLSTSINNLNAQVLTPIGIVEGANGVELVMTPPSMLVIDLEVEHESVVVGAYARYAQKYLGVRAPMVDKKSATIVGASVALASEDYYIAKSLSEYGDDGIISTESQALDIDITSSDVLSLEDAAQLAADEIFYIRQLRRELISGELGEGFFGGGLASALARLAEEERGYTELFMGCTTRTRERHTIYLPLNGETERYIVGRFSAERGLADSGDLSADPILLQLSPAKQVQMVAPVLDEKTPSRMVTFRVANMVKCDLYYNNRLLGGISMPINEFGYDFTTPIAVSNTKK